MIDRAAIRIEGTHTIAADRVSGTNDNMSRSHYHPYYELYFLEEGSRNHMLNEAMYHTEPGDFMIFAPFTMHHSFTEGHGHFTRIVLYFTPEMIDYPLLAAKMKDASGLYHPTSPVSRMIHSLLNQILMQQDAMGEFYEEYMRASLNHLLFTIMDNVNPKPRPENVSRISQIIRYIDFHASEEIHLKDLADRFYISEYYLSHEFKKRTNVTVIEYVNHARIVKAQRMILDTPLTFTQIAAQAGFSSLTHFNRTFHKVTGQSPSEFRRTHRSGGR